MSDRNIPNGESVAHPPWRTLRYNLVDTSDTIDCGMALNQAPWLGSLSVRDWRSPTPMGLSTSI